MSETQLYEMNARRGPLPRPRDNVSLVESLRFAVPLWVLEMRDASPADLVRAGLRCAWAVGERADSMMFRSAGEPTASQRNSAALAFEGLARGLASIALLEGRADFAGLHWCTAAHPDCPLPAREPAAPVSPDRVAAVVAMLDEFEAMLGGAPGACARPSPGGARALRVVNDATPVGEWAGAL